jgi:hypothetical protein
MLLSNVSCPANAWVASRPHACGHGRRRRISQARTSRSLVYETIEEEHSVILSAPFRQFETIFASPMPSGADVPISARLNFDELLNLRACHEAAHVRKASRSRDGHTTNATTAAATTLLDDEDAALMPPSTTTQATERDFMRRLYTLLKETNATSAGTTIARLNRHIEGASAAAHGNLVNAELNAGQLAAKVSSECAM